MVEKKSTSVLRYNRKLLLFNILQNFSDFISPIVIGDDNCKIPIRLLPALAAKIIPRSVHVNGDSALGLS